MRKSSLSRIRRKEFERYLNIYYQEWRKRLKVSFFCQFYKGINSSPILDLWDSKDISPSQSSREEANFIKKMSSCLRFNRQSRGQISRIRTSVFLLICETNARCNYSTDYRFAKTNGSRRYKVGCRNAINCF